MAARSIRKLPAMSGYFELGAQHGCTGERLAPCVGLTPADTHPESAGFEDSPSFLVNHGHLLCLDPERHPAGLSRLEVHPREPDELAQRYTNGCLQVGEV